MFHVSDSSSSSSSSVCQLPLLKMEQQLLVFHSVSGLASESRSRSLTHSGKTLTQKRGTPPAHEIRLNITSLCNAASRSCVWVSANVLLESGRTGGAIHQKEREREEKIRGLSQRTMSVREAESEWDNALVLLALAVCVLSRDRTSHVTFHNSRQSLLHKDACFPALFYNQFYNRLKRSESL